MKYVMHLSMNLFPNFGGSSKYQFQCYLEFLCGIKFVFTGTSPLLSFMTIILKSLYFLWLTDWVFPDLRVPEGMIISFLGVGERGKWGWFRLNIMLKKHMKHTDVATNSGNNWMICGKSRNHKQYIPNITKIIRFGMED